MMATEKDISKAEMSLVREHQELEKIINEEFKIWKKTVPLLYETIHSHALDFPSLSVQWLPETVLSEDGKYVTVKFLFGTNTSSSSQDYLKLGSFKLPSTLAPQSNSLENDIPKYSVDDLNFENNFRILSSWKHNGEVNSLRASPDSRRSLTFDKLGNIYLYNLLDSSTPIDFKYHKQEGYSLEWVNIESFLSGANDSQIAFWNISKPSTPIQCFRSHNAVINDISLNQSEPSLFGSVADDFTTQIHDLRANLNDNPAIKVQSSQIQNAFAFNPSLSTLFATGGKDNFISLFDIRNPEKPFRKLYGHNDSVIGLEWNRADPTALCSWALDRRNCLWDLTKLNEDFTDPTTMSSESSKKKISNTQDPCLSFIHGGHTNRINDVDTHPTINGLTISCGDDNLIELWRKKTFSDSTEDIEENNSENSEATAAK